jgi:magnesium-transporting ATPase (P-type)
MDDSFATAADAIEGIRGAYGNAKKIIRYLFSGSVATACTFLIPLIVSILWKGFIFTSDFPVYVFPLYVLWINLLAGSIPALAIVLNPVTEDVMKEGPYILGTVFDRGLKSKILIRGMLTTLLAIIALVSCLRPSASWEINQGRAMTAGFTVLVMSQLAFAFQCRQTPDEGFFRKFIANKLLLGIVFLIMLLHLSVIYVPAFRGVFKTQALMPLNWVPIAIAFVICSLPFEELFRTYIEDKENGKIKAEDAKEDVSANPEE